MSNYFSLGVESRVGLNFEKRRTNHYLTNKCCYGWEGVKKMFCCCTSTTKMNQVIEFVSKTDEKGNESVLFSTNGSK